MTMTLEVRGEEFNNFTEASATISLTQFVNTFSFGTTSDKPLEFPVQIGDPVRVLIDGNAIVTGFVESIDGSHSAGSRSIDIRGASRTVDVIDTTLDQTSFATPISFVKLIEKILEQAGLASIKVTNEVENLEDFKEEEVIKIDQAQSAYSVLEQYARKRQVFLITDSDGNIVITKNSGIQNNLKLFSLMNDTKMQNNVISANVRLDNKDRFNKYIAVSQTNMVGINILDDDPGAESASNQRNQAIDEDIREGRTLIFVAENSSDNVNLAERATWEANVRRALSSTYSAVVDTHLQSKGQPWQVNQLITVLDEFEGINSTLLVDEVRFNFSLNDGETTELRCVKKDAYTQEASEPEKQKQTDVFVTRFGPGDVPIGSEFFDGVIPR